MRIGGGNSAPTRAGGSVKPLTEAEIAELRRWVGEYDAGEYPVPFRLEYEHTTSAGDAHRQNAAIVAPVRHTSESRPPVLPETVTLPRDEVRRLIADLELLGEDAERLRRVWYFTERGRGPCSAELAVPGSVIAEHARVLRDAEAQP